MAMGDLVLACKDFGVQNPIKLADLDRERYLKAVCLAQDGDPEEFFSLVLKRLAEPRA